MKIMVLSALYPPNSPGGAEKSVALIAEGLAAGGHDVSVVTLHDESTETETIEEGVTVLRRPLRNLYWPFSPEDRRSVPARMTFHLMDTLNLPMARTVSELVRRRQPEIVLSNQIVCFSTLSWKAIREAGVPILHSLRDFYVLCPNSKMFRNDKPCNKQCADCRVLAYPRKRMSRHVDGITGVSQYMIDRHRACGLFPSALYLPPILSAVTATAVVSARLTAAPEPVRHFGYIGRVTPEKGIDRLLDGLLSLPPERWKLLIAGTGPDTYLEHLRKRCAGLPVGFLGFVPDSRFYSAVDVVVVPSIWEEPQPRAVLEAFGRGLTVIASARGGIPEIVRPGETGYLVDLDNPQEMAAAIARTADQPMEGRAYGEAGRRMVVARTRARVAEDYENASRQVIEHARRLPLDDSRVSLSGAGNKPVVSEVTAELPRA
jgi:glycosyltransferase involved in cell wall biosynthesis